MRYVLLMIAVLTVSTTIHAQKTSMPEKMENVKDKLDPATIAGLQLYDKNEVFQKLKIKKASQKSEIGKLIDSYNANIEQLKGENLGILVKLGSDMKNIFSNKDFKLLWDARSDFKDQVKMVRDQSKVYHSDLESALQEALKKRKEKKWFRYQEDIRKEQESTFEIGDIFSYVGF